MNPKEHPVKYAVWWHYSWKMAIFLADFRNGFGRPVGTKGV